MKSGENGLIGPGSNDYGKKMELSPKVNSGKFTEDQKKHFREKLEEALSDKQKDPVMIAIYCDEMLSCWAKNIR